MMAIDYRNETFEQIRGRCDGLRRQVYEAWQKFGPGTTRYVATLARMDLLTFRPRTTELVQLGLVCLDDSSSTVPSPSPRPSPQGRGRRERIAHEGVYRARLLHEWESWVEKERE